MLKCFVKRQIFLLRKHVQGVRTQLVICCTTGVTRAVRPKVFYGSVDGPGSSGPCRGGRRPKFDGRSWQRPSRAEQTYLDPPSRCPDRDDESSEVTVVVSDECGSWCVPSGLSLRVRGGRIAPTGMVPYDTRDRWRRDRFKTSRSVTTPGSLPISRVGELPQTWGLRLVSGSVIRSYRVYSPPPCSLRTSGLRDYSPSRTPLTRTRVRDLQRDLPSPPVRPFPEAPCVLVFPPVCERRHVYRWGPLSVCGRLLVPRGKSNRVTRQTQVDLLLALRLGPSGGPSKTSSPGASG